MTLNLYWIDGFESRDNNGEWPGAAYGENPYGNRGADIASRKPNYPGEGRYWGQAGGGRYDTYFGGVMNMAPTKISTFTPQRWFQTGFWMKLGTHFNDATEFPISRFPRRFRTDDSDDDDTWFAWKGSGDNYELCLKNYRYDTYQLTTTNSGVYNTRPMVEDKWYYYEYRLYADTSSGVAELRLNGVQLHRFTGVRTAVDNTGWNGFSYSIYDAFNTSQDHRDDDLYVMFADSEGELSWLGRSTAEPIVPAADGDSNDWTPSTGSTRWPVVDDLPAADDSYVSSSTAGNKQLFTMSQIEQDRTRTIHGVKVTARAKKNGPGVRTLRAICKIGGSTYNGTTYRVRPGWREIYHIWRLNPDTSTAWTTTTLASAQFGFEQVA